MLPPIFRGFCFLLSFSTILSTSTVLAQTKCNGYSELCSRSYSNVSQVGSHDSAFVGTSVADNQHLDVASQLNMGIRFLTIQAHEFLNDITLCHTSCAELDAGTMNDYLKTVKTWMDAKNNSNEVVTLLIVNNDNLNATQFGDVFKNVGLDTYAFAPSATLALDQWPSLQELIMSGKRLVVFMDYQANTNDVSYILPEWTYFFETPYDVTSTDDFAKCDIDRPAGSTADGKMYIVNHFLDQSVLGVLIPDTDAADSTNGQPSILSQTTVCQDLYGRAPKAVLLDWIDKGDVFGAERSMNGLSL